MHPGFVDAAKMLAVPKLGTRTEAQAEGADCVWCGGPASVRLSTCGGALALWHPRACRPCTRREADRVYRLHITTCARCTPWVYCPDARALDALSRSSKRQTG
jgi:hypothetical protein